MSLEFIKRQLESSVDFSELRLLVRGTRISITFIIILSVIFCGLISIIPFVAIVQEMRDIWHVILPITGVAAIIVAGILVGLAFHLISTTIKIRRYVNSLDLEGIYRKSFNKILNYEGLTFKSLNIIHPKLIFSNTKKWDAFSFYEDVDLFTLPFDKNTAVFDYKGHELVFQSQSVILKRVPFRVIAENRKKGLETKSKKVINIYSLIWKNKELVKKYKGVSVITGSSKEEFFLSNNEEFNTKFFVDDESENTSGADEMFNEEFIGSLLDSSNKRNHITFHGLVINDEGVIVSRTAETSNYRGEISVVKNAFATSEDRVINFVTKNINADILNFSRSVRYLVGLE